MATALGLLSAMGAPALAQLSDKPIQIEANQAQYSDRSGVSTYSGDVVLTQGGLVLHGDELRVTRNKSNGAIEAVLTGAPATLDKAAGADTPDPINGNARRMEYRSSQALLVLTGDAFIQRGGDTISGETITHNLNSTRTEAQNSGSSGRVKITLEPDTTQPANDGDEADDTTEPSATPVEPEAFVQPEAEQPFQPAPPEPETFAPGNEAPQ